MPHKRNPIKSEQISGLARVLRGNAQAGLENVALWHERDISHSSVERVILPDSTILLDYMQHRTVALVRGMTVDAERMRANLELTHGALFSQRVLLALVEAGHDPRRGLPHRAGAGPARVGRRASRCASCSPADARARGLDLDAIFDYGALRAPRAGDPRAAGRDRRERHLGRRDSGRSPIAAGVDREHDDRARRPAPHRQRQGPRDVRAGVDPRPTAC